MKKCVTVAILLTASILVGCASTEYKAFEGKGNVIEGSGGTKVVVDGMEIWDNGEPPRKFKILGIIDDARPGGLIPMSQLRSDMVKKAREAGGDSIIQLNSESRISGYYTSGSASGYTYGTSTRLHGSATTTAVRRNASRFAVISYVD